MTVTKVLARDYKFEVNTGTTVSPTWTEIKGLNTWSPSRVKNDANTTSYDEGGVISHIVASRGGSVTLTGFVLEDTGDGSRDPGQEAVNALDELIGYDSLGEFRITTPGGTLLQGLASVQVTEGGGGVDDASAWEAVLTKSGAWTKS